MLRTTTRFRQMLEAEGTAIVPGAWDALSAALVERAGFQAVAMTGAGVSCVDGYPDLGLLTLSEVVDRARAIVRGTALPVIADADTGYGNALNVRRTVQELERAGVAALHLEDQVTPKRCGLFDGIEVIETDEMAQKLRAAVEARTDPDLCIVARTDVRAVAGVDAVIARSNAYLAAGADAIFVFDLHSHEELRQAAAQIDGPAITHVSRGARMAPMPPSELGAMGYRAVMFPLTPLQAAYRAAADALEAIAADGAIQTLGDRMIAPRDVYELVGLSDFEALAARYSGPAPVAG